MQKGSKITTCDLRSWDISWAMRHVMTWVELTNLKKVNLFSSLGWVGGWMA